MSTFSNESRVSVDYFSQDAIDGVVSSFQPNNSSQGLNGRREILSEHHARFATHADLELGAQVKSFGNTSHAIVSSVEKTGPLVSFDFASQFTHDTNGGHYYGAWFYTPDHGGVNSNLLPKPCFFCGSGRSLVARSYKSSGE